MQGLRRNKGFKNFAQKVVFFFFWFGRPVYCCITASVLSPRSRLILAKGGVLLKGVQAAVVLGSSYSRLLATSPKGQATRVTIMSAIMSRLSILGTQYTLRREPFGARWTSRPVVRAISSSGATATRAFRHLVHFLRSSEKKKRTHPNRDESSNRTRGTTTVDILVSRV